MKKNDWILIAAILAVVLVAFLAVNFFKEDGAYVVVRVDGKVLDGSLRSRLHAVKEVMKQ
jgi:hypothetical protein